MSKIVIKNIEHTEKVSQAGKPYTSCKITVWDKANKKDAFLSGFGSGITKTWNNGDTIEVDVSKTEQGYLNFKESEYSKPSENPIVVLLREISAKLDYLNPNAKEQVEQTEQELVEDFGFTEDVTVPSIQEGSTEKIKVENIPF